MVNKDIIDKLNEKIRIIMLYSTFFFIMGFVIGVIIIFTLFVSHEPTQRINNLITIDKCNNIVEFWLYKSGLNKQEVDNLGISIYFDYIKYNREVK